MTQGKTICQCGRDDIHPSKDCWTIENWIKNSRNMTKEEADGLDEFCWGELKDNRIDSLNELTKQAQELDMGYPFTVNSGDLISINDTQTYYISFNNKENKELGKLDFKGDKLVFEGNVEESAEVFIDYLLKMYNQRIEEIKEDAFSDGYDIGYDAGRD